MIMNISLSDAEKHEFSTLSFQVWEHIKQLEIMKSQNSSVHLFTLKKPKQNKNKIILLHYFFPVTF